MTNLIVARNNRWVLASNGMPVALARWWGTAADVHRQYPSYGPVTEEEFVAALAFYPFPALSSDGTVMETGAIYCRCGEQVSSHVDRSTTQRCMYCGRTYRLRVEEVTDGK